MPKKRLSPKAALLIMSPLLAVVLLLPLVAIVWARVGLGGDGLKEGEVEIGSAVPQGRPLQLPDLDKGEVLPARQWPSACAFVSQGDVEAILPQAEKITREEGWIKDISIREYAEDPRYDGDDTAPAGQCLYSMRLPGETYEATRLWVRIHAIADPGLAERYYERVAPGLATNQGGQGADSCALTGLFEGIWFCRKGSVIFSVGGQTTVAFKGRYAPAPFAWRDSVNPQIVRAVTAKIA